MFTLGIDTTSYTPSVVLLDGDKVLAEVSAAETGSGEVLISLIHDLLAMAQAGISEIGQIAVCRGPGSYTGIRNGLSAVYGFSFQRSMTLLGISAFFGNIIAFLLSQEQHSLPKEMLGKREIFFAPRVRSAPQESYASVVRASRLDGSEFFGTSSDIPKLSEICLSTVVPAWISRDADFNTELLKFWPQATHILPVYEANMTQEKSTPRLPVFARFVGFGMLLGKGNNGGSCADQGYCQITSGSGNLEPLYLKPVQAKTLAERQNR